MQDRPNLVFLMTDQHRCDHVGWHPRSRFRMPNLDRLAEGCVFTDCVSADPICTPARCALFTGRYAHQVAMQAMSGDLSPQYPTIFRELQRSGYHVMGVGKFHLWQGWPWQSAPGTGHPEHVQGDLLKRYGFDHVWTASGKQLAQKDHCDYAEHLARKGILDAYRAHIANRGPNVVDFVKQVFTGEPWPFDESDYIDIVTTDQGLAALDQRPTDRPFCLFLSLCGPHPPYDPPARYFEGIEDDENSVVPGADEYDAGNRERLRRIRWAYRAMLACIDEQVGRVLDRLEADGLLDSTVVLHTSDHGEMLGDHGHVQKSRPYWQAAGVPLAIRHPGHLDGRLCAAPVEHVDISATILDCAGLDPRATLARPWPRFLDRIPGRSLLPVIRGEADRVRDEAFSECDGRWWMLADDAWKYVYELGDDPDAPRERLFDRRADPDEEHDLAADSAQAERVVCYRTRLLHRLAATPTGQTRWVPTIECQDPANTDL